MVTRELTKGITRDITRGITQPFNHFIFTVKTDNTGTSASDQFTLPLTNTTQDFYIEWGDGSSAVHITAYDQAEVTHTFVGGAGTYEVKIWGSKMSWAFNNGGDKAKLLDIIQVGMFSHGDESGAFYGCSNLTSITATDKPLIKDGSTNIASFFRDTGLTSVDWTNYDFTTITAAASFLNGVTLTTANLDTLLSNLQSNISSLQNSVAIDLGSGVYSIGDSETTIYDLTSDKSWTITSAGSEISNLIFWIDALDSSTITLSGSDIATWNEKSLNDYNISTGLVEYDQTDPLKPVAQFDGSSDYLYRITPTEINNWTAARTFVMVVKVPASPVGYLWQTGASGSGYRDEQIYFDGSNRLAFRAHHSVAPGLVQLVGSQPSTGFHVITMQLDTSTNSRAAELFLDNVSVATAASIGTSNLNPDSFYLGVDEDGGGYNTKGDYTNAGIAEFRIYDRLLTSDELDDIHTLLNSKWGIS